MQLSEDQRKAVEAVELWYAMAPGTSVCSDPDCLDYKISDSCDATHTHGHSQAYRPFAIGGLAGTGKTTLIKELSALFGFPITFATPTHKAAAVLRGKVGENVRTYHSLIYRVMVIYRCRRSRRTLSVDPAHTCNDPECCHTERFVPCGRCMSECVIDEEPTFTQRSLLEGKHRLIVVDEASMLTDAQVADIRLFGVPVLLVGDHGQLPPVKEAMNQQMAKPDATLDVNHRQGEGSQITALAYRIRAGERPRAGSYGDLAVLDYKAHSDVVQGLLKRFTVDENRAVIVWRNATRAMFNAAMRGHDGLPQVGDRVVCLKGCELPTADHGEPMYVHNGALGTIAGGGHRGASKVIDLEVQLDTGEIVLTKAALAQFGLPEPLAYNDSRRPKGNDWQSWDYGYAITAHKAQGSEWDEVIVIDENPMDYSRWMYTAVTRAAKRLVVVKW